MSTSNASTRCCSDLTLDRLLVGDVDDGEAQTLRAHLEQSAPCRARYDVLVADRAAFVAAPPVLDFAPKRQSPASSTKPARRARWSVAAGLSALAAGVAVFAMQQPGAAADAPVVDVVRSKGSALNVTIHRKRGDVASALLRTDTITAGDALRAEVTTAAPAHIVVVSVDADGASAWNTAPVHVDSGTTTLPFAVELTADGGDLAVFVYACDHDVDVAKVERANGAAIAGCAVSATNLQRAPR